MSLAIIVSLLVAVSVQAGRDVVLKTRGWREAVAAASTDSAPGMDEVTKQLMTSLKAKRALLEAAGISRYENLPRFTSTRAPRMVSANSASLQ